LSIFRQAALPLSLSAVMTHRGSLPCFLKQRLA
jgi:hypothetical protein